MSLYNMGVPYRFEIEDLIVESSMAQADLYVNSLQRFIEFPMGPSGARFKCENKGKNNYTLFSYKGKIFGWLKPSETKQVTIEVSPVSRVTVYNVTAPTIKVDWEENPLKATPEILSFFTRNELQLRKEKIQQLNVSSINKKLEKGLTLSAKEKQYLLSRPMTDFSKMPDKVKKFIASVADIRLNDIPSLDSPCEMNDVRSIRLKD